MFIWCWPLLGLAAPYWDAKSRGVLVWINKEYGDSKKLLELQ